MATVTKASKRATTTSPVMQASSTTTLSKGDKSTTINTYTSNADALKKYDKKQTATFVTQLKDPNAGTTSDPAYGGGAGRQQLAQTYTTDTPATTPVDEVQTDYVEGEDADGSGSGYQIEDVSSLININTGFESVDTSFLDMRNVLGIFGIPYQFLPHVDPRVDQSTTNYKGVGKEYADHILSNLPIVFLAPGLPNFMTKFSDNDKQTVTQIMSEAFSGLLGNVSLDSLQKDSGKYYTFEYAADQFYTYCNPACHIVAGYMGVGSESIDGTAITSLNWMGFTTGKLSSLFGRLMDVTSYTSIPFYIESDSQISESFSNEVTDSSLAGMVDSVSSMGREAMFLLGYGSSQLGFNLMEGYADSQAQYDKLQEVLGGLAKGGGFIQNVINNLTSVATGGRLVFPKIWSDSSFNRSYEITVKLRSPDLDALSIYFNIIVPYLHCLCLMLPRQVNGNPNGFFSPFLVRAIYKGFFNVDMGIITSMSVTRGDTAQWSPDGIPTAIDIHMTISDLYDAISMTPTTASNLKYDTLDNTNMMDYIATLCGINIYTPEIGRTIQMWFTNNFIERANSVINIGVWGRIQMGVANMITSVWRGKSM